LHLLVLLRICKPLTMHRINSLQLNHLLMRGKEICYYTEIIVLTQCLFSLFMHVTEHNGNGNNGSKICFTNPFSVIPGQMPLLWFWAYLAWHIPCHPETTAKFSCSIFPAVLGLPQSQTYLYYTDKGISSMKVCSPTFIYMWFVYTFMFVLIQRIFKIILDINWMYHISELKAPGLKIALPYLLNGLHFTSFSISYTIDFWPIPLGLIFTSQ